MEISSAKVRGKMLVGSRFKIRFWLKSFAIFFFVIFNCIIRKTVKFKKSKSLTWFWLSEQSLYSKSFTQTRRNISWWNQNIHSFTQNQKKKTNSMSSRIKWTYASRDEGKRHTLSELCKYTKLCKNTQQIRYITCGRGMFPIALFIFIYKNRSVFWWNLRTLFKYQPRLLLI